MRTKPELDLFRQIPLFSQLEDHHLQVLLFAARRKIFAAGKTFLRQGERTGKAYLLLSGTAKAMKGKRGSGAVVALFDPGVFFGEAAVLARTPYPFTIVATSECVVREFTQELLLKFFEEFQESAQRMREGVLHRLGASLDRLRALSLPKSSSPLLGGEASVDFEIRP